MKLIVERLVQVTDSQLKTPVVHVEHRRLEFLGLGSLIGIILKDYQ